MNCQAVNAIRVSVPIFAWNVASSDPQPSISPCARSAEHGAAGLGQGRDSRLLCTHLQRSPALRSARKEAAWLRTPKRRPRSQAARARGGPRGCR
jgi:hypothetical protein